MQTVKTLTRRINRVIRVFAGHICYFVGIVMLPLIQSDDFLYNTELNDLRIIFFLRKSEASHERISFCNVIEKMMEMGYTVCHARLHMTSYIC